jgi:hypothetical protein
VTITAQSAPWFYFDEFKSGALDRTPQACGFWCGVNLVGRASLESTPAPDRRCAGKFQKKHLKTHMSCG